MTNILNSCNNITTIQPCILPIVNCNIKGNLIPTDWYKIITTKTGRPDHAAITLLAEVVYWYRPAKYKKTASGNIPIDGNFFKFLGDAWQSSYEYLSNKFKLSKETIRRAFVKLEDMGFIKRDLRTVSLRGQKYGNALFILLGDKIWQLFTKNHSVITNNKSKNSFVEAIKSNLNDAANNSTNNSSSNTANSSFSIPTFVDPSPQIVGEHYIDNKNKKKNISKTRSSKSKFCENFEEEKIEKIPEESQEISKVAEEIKKGRRLALSMEPIIVQADASIKLPSAAEAPVTTLDPISSSVNNEANINPVEEQSYIASNIVDKIKTKFGFRSVNSKKPLESFYPITKEEASSLRFESGREFDLCYINKLMQHLAKKCPNNSFYGRKQVLQYLAKALKHELRQAPMVNNLGFRFKSEIGQDEIKIEKYLSETEYSKDTAAESQLRKKIAGVFESKFAYALLTNLTINKVESPTMTVFMAKMIEFDQGKIELLLNQAKAVYGQGIERIDINCEQGEYVMSTSQGIVKLPSMSIKNKAVDNTSTTNNQCKKIITKTNITEEVNTPQETQNPIWSKIRAKLINHYGEAVDKSWFSKLAPIEEDKQDKDKQSNGLALRAPTNFIKSWIESNYLSIICRFAKDELYENYREIKIIGPECRNNVYA